MGSRPPLKNYLYISDAKVENYLGQHEKVIKEISAGLGINVGVLKLDLRGTAEPLSPMTRQARLAVAEVRFREAFATRSPETVTGPGQAVQGAMDMVWGKERGMWFGGMLSDRAVVLSGSAVHATGVLPSGRELLPPMSELPDQLRALTSNYGEARSVGPVDDFASKAAVSFALGEWGGAAAQPLEFLAVVNHVAPEVEWTSGRYFLVLGSPLYVALLMERAEPAEPEGTTRASRLVARTAA